MGASQVQRDALLDHAAGRISDVVPKIAGLWTINAGGR